MVKADVRRDYYSDLGVSPSADTDDIKKQFRKLALKYHPDRNPGREAEYNAKFQAIQAAHEILSDSQHRLKYDTERLRAGYGKNYGPPPTNTPRRANTSAYPGAASGKSPSFAPRQPQPSSNAQRYANYAKAAPQQPWDKVYEAQTRADAFRGFQEMKSNANMPGWSNFNPRTGKPAQQASRGTTNAMPTSRGKSAYEHFNAKPVPTGPPRTQSTRKKQGFAPGTPGGDEPMARNVSAYTSVPRPDRSSAFFDSVPSPTAKKKMAAETSRPVSPQDDYVFPEFERSSTRYATAGGERTYFSSTGLGRSTSMRDSSNSSKARSRTNPPSPTHTMSSRHHSASPKLKTPLGQTFPSSTSSSDLDEDEPLQFRPKATPKTRLPPNQKFSDFYKFSKDWNHGSGEESSGKIKTPKFRDWRPRHRFGSARPRSYHEFVDLNTDSEYYQGHDSDSAAFAYRSGYTVPHAEAAQNDAQGNPSGDYHNGQKIPPHIDSFRASMAGNMNGGPRSRSHDNLNKRFSASEWDGAFQEAKLFVPTGIGSDQRTRSRTSPTRGRASTRPSSAAQSTVTSSSESSTRKQPTPFAQAKFSADVWAQQLRSETWPVPHLETGKQQANTRSARTARKLSKPTAKPQPQPATVSTEAEEEEATVSDHAFGGTTSGVEAMEIDDEPSTRGGVRVDGLHEAQTEFNKQPNVASMPTKMTSPISSSSNGVKVSRAKNNNLFNLKKLNNVAPFTTTNNGGIDDLKDIHTTLPFESRPNNPNVARRIVQPRDLNLPNPPKRPRRPAVIPAGTDPNNMVLSQKAWERYVAEMSAYMREWNNFNRKMIRHFNARQDAVETGLIPRWINAVGDSTKLNVDPEDGGPIGGEEDSDVDDSDDNLIPGQPTGGFNAYLRGVEEDFKVREHWDVSWERHRTCILELGQLRDWIRHGGKVVA